MGGGEKHDQRGNFLNIFYLGQMMLKLGRNIQWVEILRNLKYFDGVISNSKV